MTVLFWILTAVFAAVDRLSKYIAEINISEGEHFKVLSLGDTEILAFSMHKNTGAAFSSFTGKTVALAAVTAAAMLFMAVFFMKIKHKHPFLTVSFAMIMGGGIGNLIDRIFMGGVTDFINLFPFTFIFNFADICIVIGGIFLCIYYIFIDDKYLSRFAEEKTPQSDGESH